MHILRNSHPLPKYDPRTNAEAEAYLRLFGHSQSDAITGIHVRLIEDNRRRPWWYRQWRKVKRAASWTVRKWCALPEMVHWTAFGIGVFLGWLLMLWAFVEKMN